MSTATTSTYGLSYGERDGEIRARIDEQWDEQWIDGATPVEVTANGTSWIATNCAGSPRCDEEDTK